MNSIVFDTINTLLVIITLFNLALLIPMIRSVGANIETRVHAINIIMLLLWIVTMIFFRSQNDDISFWLRALYTSAIFIGVTYMQFTFYYPVKIKRAELYVGLVTLLAVATSLLTMFSNLIVVSATKVIGGEPSIVFGPGYLLYMGIILVPFILAFSRYFYLIVKHHHKLWYLFIGYLMSANIAFVTNLFLPWVGIFDYNWVGQYFTIILVSFTTYSIIKFNSMNIKLVAINTGVVLLCIITFSQILFADSTKNLLVSAIVFLIALVTGYYLVKMSKNERLSLEHTLSLNKRIKNINQELEVANKKLQSLDTLKSEFISLASHQLRSPLTVIKGYASTLTDGVVGELEPKQKEIVRHIYTAAQGLANVVEDFLNVTKIEQGGMKYEFGLVDIKKIAEDLSSDMRIAAEDRGLTFESVIDSTRDYTIEGDSTKLKQVFLNLVDNSIKYTKEGFVRVTLSQNALDESMKFSVSDSGIGISKETIEKLFTKFGRGAGSALNGGGSGLGLYLAQSIVEAHKGRIEVSSPGEGKGSTFSVYLPLHQDGKR